MKSSITREPDRLAAKLQGRSSVSTSAKLAPGFTGRDDRFSGGGTEDGAGEPGGGSGSEGTDGPPGMLTAGGFHGDGSPPAVLSGRTPAGGGTPAGAGNVEPGIVAGIGPGAEPAPGAQPPSPTRPVGDGAGSDIGGM